MKIPTAVAAAIAVALTLLFAPAAMQAADPKVGAPGGKSPVATVEAVPGAPVPRVTLATKAAERLGIEIGKVGEEVVVRRQMVSGIVTPPLDKAPPAKPGAPGSFATGPAPAAGFAGFTRVTPPPVPQPAAARATAGATATDGVWVNVMLSPREWERLAKDKPARLLPLATREKLIKEVSAEPAPLAPVEDGKRTMLSFYYAVPGKEHGLAPGTRVRVELPIAGTEEKQRVVQYSAVLYDAKGAAWVYVNTGPLAFQRARIAVDRVVGDLAVLADGPQVGTPVVTVGAAMLYGVEVFRK